MNKYYKIKEEFQNKYNFIVGQRDYGRTYFENMKKELRERRKIKMFEVTYSINGIIKTININANDQFQVQEIFLNMYSGSNAEIINVRRI